eukprot:scaffold4124_cov267-Chaetoceros_neogracile.AAC.14
MKGILLVPSTLTFFICSLNSSHATSHRNNSAPSQRYHRPLTATNTRLTAAFALPEISTLVTQAASGLVTYVGLVAYYDRPRGRLDVDTSNIEAKQSQVQGAGLGLYSCKDMPKGTVLGTYPGVVRPTNKYMLKSENAPDAGTYAWRFTDNDIFIDPTDQDGQLSDYCLGGTDDFPLSYFLHNKILRWKVSCALTRINEPPLGGGGCNVRSDENLNTREVVFSLSRSVHAGEELFMDYGLTYDRSGYGDGQ